MTAEKARLRKDFEATLEIRFEEAKKELASKLEWMASNMRQVIQVLDYTEAQKNGLSMELEDYAASFAPQIYIVSEMVVLRERVRILRDLVLTARALKKEAK